MDSSVYISEYRIPDLNPIRCILKARYTDFHVTEILPSETLIEITSPLPNTLELCENDFEQKYTHSIDGDNEIGANKVDTKQQTHIFNNAYLETNYTRDIEHATSKEIILFEPVDLSVNWLKASLNDPKELNDWKILEPWASLLLVDKDNIEQMNEFATSIYSLLHSKNDSKGSSFIESHPIFNKQIRTDIHKLLKHDSVKCEGFFLSSLTIPDTSAIKVSKIVAKKNSDRSSSLYQDVPNFIQFYLYKENKSTMEAINKIAFYLRKPSKCFSFAGTKDKRAVTIQRVVINNKGNNKVTPQRLLSLNKVLRSFGIWISDVKPAQDQLLLGSDLWGNRFSIFLRDLQGSKEMAEMEINIRSLKEKGFINYYGMQRFGTIGDFMTHLVGIEILKENWSKAVRLIMAPRTPGQEKEKNEQCRTLWLESPSLGTANKIISELPGSMVAERCILGHFISQNCTSDYLGAIQKIPHEMKLMYVHAVQSLIWNFISSERIVLGRSLMVGDLIMDESNSNSILLIENSEQLDRFSFEDIVLPLPGFNVTYPAIPSLIEKVEVFIENLFKAKIPLSSFGITCKVGKLSGAYRKLLSRPIDLSFEFINYSFPNETVLESLLDPKDPTLEEDPPCKKNKPMSYTGLKIVFSLHSSCYATMALREIIRIDTSSSFQKTLTHK